MMQYFSDIHPLHNLDVVGSIIFTEWMIHDGQHCHEMLCLPTGDWYVGPYVPLVPKFCVGSKIISHWPSHCWGSENICFIGSQVYKRWSMSRLSNTTFHCIGYPEGQRKP